MTHLVTKLKMKFEFKRPSQITEYNCINANNWLFCCSFISTQFVSFRATSAEEYPIRYTPPNKSTKMRFAFNASKSMMPKSTVGVAFKIR